MKKRYLRRRNSVNKLDKSGPSTEAVNKAKREVDAYSFLFWLVSYLKPRKTKSNIPEEDEEESHGESLDRYDPERSIDLDQENEFFQNDKKNCTTQSQKEKKTPKQELLSVDQKQIVILKKMEKELNDDNENHNKDSEYLFSQAIAADIRAFSEAERCMIKHEINNIIFKYQINKFRNNLFSNTVMPNISTLLQASDFNSNDRPLIVSSRASSNSSWQSNSY